MLFVISLPFIGQIVLNHSEEAKQQSEDGAAIEVLTFSIWNDCYSYFHTCWHDVHYDY